MEQTPLSSYLGIFSRGMISRQSGRWVMAKRSPLYSGDPRLVSLGHAIRLARLDLGWSQERLAAEAEVDRSYMGGVERGEHNLSVISLSRIAQVLNLTLAELFTRAEL